MPYPLQLGSLVSFDRIKCQGIGGVSHKYTERIEDSCVEMGMANLQKLK